MNINRNILEGSISAEDLAAIQTSIADLETRLTILVGLSPEERMSLTGMGQPSESFAAQALLAAQQHAGLMPPNLNVPAIQRDKELREQLLPLYERMRTLTTKMEHTIMLAGTEYYRGALLIYRALQAFGRAAGLDDLLTELKRRFIQSRKAKPATGTGDNPTGPVI